MASDTLTSATSASDNPTLPPLLQPAADTDFAREYDVASRVPDFAASLSDWNARSSFARATHPGLLDLRYGETEAETLDLFLPEPHPADGHPLLVFIHGGFWRRLHKDDFSWIAPPYVERGIAVAVVNYGLAPATPLEEIVDQIRRGLVWLYRNAPRHHIDRCRIVVSGHSAGGHLACMALATDWTAFAPDLPPDLIAAGIALSPLADLAPLAAVPILHNDLDFTVERVATLSPIHLAPATTAPLIGAVGGDESAEFRRQLALLAHSWSSVWRGEVPMPGYNHLTLCDALAEPGSALFAASIELLSATRLAGNR